MASGNKVDRALLTSDTSRDAERMQVTLWQRMSPLEKARAVSALNLTVQELSLAGIRQRHPKASERECQLRFAVLTLGRELACRVYPIEPCGWAHGQLAVYTALLDYVEHGTDFEKAGAIHATYWAHIGKAPCTAAEAEALQAVRERLAEVLLREFIENPALDVRRSIILRLNLDVGSYPDDLKPLVRRARAVAVRHPDDYIRHRASVQMGHEKLLRPLPPRKQLPEAKC